MASSTFPSSASTKRSVPKQLSAVHQRNIFLKVVLRIEDWHTDCYYHLDEGSGKNTASWVLAVLIRPATQALQMTKHNWCYITFWEMKVSICCLGAFLCRSVLCIYHFLSLSFNISHSLNLGLLPSYPLWWARETERWWENINFHKCVSKARRLQCLDERLQLGGSRGQFWWREAGDDGLEIETCFLLMRFCSRPQHLSSPFHTSNRLQHCVQTSKISISLSIDAVT